MNDTPTPRTDAEANAGNPFAGEMMVVKAGNVVSADLARQLEGEINAWQTELSKVMPPDFKDWWENSKAEWPLVARWVIENKNRRLEQLERELGSPTDEPDANTTAHARINWWKDRCDDLNEQLAAKDGHADEIYKAAVDLAAKLEDDLEQERALADRLANALQVYAGDVVHLGHWMPAGAVILSERALAAWKEARKTETKDD